MERGGGDAPHGAPERADRADGRVLWAAMWVGICAACGARGAYVRRGTRALTASVCRLGCWSEQQWLMRPLARWYQNNVSHELAKYGESLACPSARNATPPTSEHRERS